MGRVGNKKSRTGCARCKSRRVKCDENRPACSWCASHFLECEYPDTTNGAYTSASPAVTDTYSDHSTSGLLKTTHSTDMTASQMELGLFHYYSYTVARTFPFVDKERGIELHADMVPQASLQCASLRDVMYSYALLHMHIQSSRYEILPHNADYFNDVGIQFDLSSQVTTNPSTTLLSFHQDYLDRALQRQRDVVAEINTKNADGICIAAILLAQVALVHSSQLRLDQEYCIPLDWFRLQSSFSACLAVARPLLRMDSATSMMIHSSPGIDNRDLEYQVPRIFHDLVDWQSIDGVEYVSHQSRDTYRRCVVYIESIYKRIAEKEPWQSLGRRILAFPAVGSSAFFSLMEDHQPRALVILAHLLAMTKRLDRAWWIFDGVADYHINGISTLIPSEWQWALRWPMKIIETGAADECFQAVKSPSVVE